MHFVRKLKTLGAFINLLHKTDLFSIKEKLKNNIFFVSLFKKHHSL